MNSSEKWNCISYRLGLPGILLLLSVFLSHTQGSYYCWHVVPQLFLFLGLCIYLFYHPLMLSVGIILIIDIFEKYFLSYLNFSCFLLLFILIVILWQCETVCIRSNNKKILPIRKTYVFFCPSKPSWSWIDYASFKEFKGLLSLILLAWIKCKHQGDVLEIVG